MTTFHHNKEEFRKEHHSRNAGLISEEEQQKITDTTLLIAGCGVGSLIAISAARIGFEKFILVDGDTVELSNTNRQGFTTKDVGKLKVNALSQKIKHINPHAEVKKCPYFVDLKNAAKLVHQVDLVIDSIDPTSAQAVIGLHREAQKEHKTIIQPTDVGWGAMIQIFTPESVSYEKMIGLNPHTPTEKIDNDEAFGKFVEFFIKIMPPYVQKLAMDVAEGRRPHYPQPVPATYTLSAMTVVAARRVALGLPVKIAPDYVLFDPDTSLDPNAT